MYRQSLGPTAASDDLKYFFVSSQSGMGVRAEALLGFSVSTMSRMSSRIILSFESAHDLRRERADKELPPPRTRRLRLVIPILMEGRKFYHNQNGLYLL